MVGSGSSGGGGEEGFTGRAAIGYDHGYDGEVFYLGLALDERYVEGWVEGCLERIGEDDPDEEQLFRDLWEDETQRELVIESLQAFEISQSILYPTCMQSRDTYCDAYYYCRRYTSDGGRIWWRYVVRASRELTSGESSGGSKVSPDGCSSTTRRQARPMPNSSPTVRSVAGRWSGRLSGRRPLPYFPRLTSITCKCVPASTLVCWI